MGPPASIWRASRSDKVSSTDTRAARDGFHADAAALRRDDQVEAAQDHRNAQPLAHVQPGAGGEFHELGVRLPQIFDPEAEDAVTEQGDADQDAAPVAARVPPEGEGEDQEKDN